MSTSLGYVFDFLGTIYDTMSALCASHSLSAKDLGCARHAARCAICQTDHIIMFPFTWNGFDHPHLKTAEENVKSQIEGMITVRWQVHCAHQEASPFFFKSRHATLPLLAAFAARSRQGSLQGLALGTRFGITVPPVKGPVLTTWPPALWQG